MLKKEKSSFVCRKLFRELRYEIGKVLFFTAFLDAAILFFALNIILTLFNMSFLVSATIAFVFLVYRTIKGFRKRTVRKLEDGNPEIHEILRTAFDYQKQNSLMVQGLFHDLQKKMATVSTGVLINPKKTITKIVIIGLLAFTPVLIMSFAPQIIQANPFAGMTLGDILGGGGADRIGGLFDTDMQTVDEFGEADIIELGDNKLDLNIKQGGGAVDFENIEDPEEKNFGFNDFPADVSVQAAETSGESAPQGLEAELIKDFSCRAKGTC